MSPNNVSLAVYRYVSILQNYATKKPYKPTLLEGKTLNEIGTLMPWLFSE